MKNKLAIICIGLIFLNTICVFSQTQVDINKKQFKAGKSGFKEAWKAIKEGDDLFLMGKGAYYLATEKYKKAFDYNGTNPELNYKLGVSMLLSDERKLAVNYLQLAYQAKPEVTDDIKYFLARAYHLNNEFDQAIAHYGDYKAGLSKKQLKKEGQQVDLLIAQCSNGKRLVNDPVRAVIENAGSKINSEYEDYSPVVSANDSLFLFTSRRQHSKKSKLSEVDYKYFESVYYTTKTGNDWGIATKFFKSNKVKENLAVIGMSNDARTIYFYKGSEGKGDIYYSTKKKGKWQKPSALKGKVNSPEKEGAAALSKDGNVLYFSSERKKGQGGSDIWISTKKKNGSWDKPVNAQAVNTPFDETSVAIHPNGKILYFSSQGHNSMGGADVFQCDIDGSGNLSNVKNVGYPVNSAGDDMFYTPSVSGKIAYLSSIREFTVGASDIYKVIILGPEKPLETGISEIDAAGAPGKNNNIFFDEAPKLDEIPVEGPQIELTGLITDAAETSKTLDGTIQLIDAATKKAIDKVIADKSGTFKMVVPEAKAYIIKALAFGYMPYSEDVDFSDGNSQRVGIALDKIKVGNKMVLKNIYFNFATARLKKESYQELENVYAFLMGNPGTVIEIAGYTDNIGSIEANKMISTMRAKACVKYLTDKGVEADRLKYKGYGFLHPIAGNHTPQGRQKNRRVEFKVLKH